MDTKSHLFEGHFPQIICSVINVFQYKRILGNDKRGHKIKFLSCYDSIKLFIFSSLFSILTVFNDVISQLSTHNIRSFGHYSKVIHFQHSQLKFVFNK